ncbi:MAG: PH domain-containing protein [Pseudomonadota bacterium]
MHWIVYGRALTFFFFGILALIASWQIPDIEIGAQLLAAILFVFGIVVFLHAWIIRATTEVVVTDRRIIHKRGVISRHTEEMNITKVETVDVDQGIWGRILGYGTLIVRGTGGSWEPLRRLASPLQIRNAIIVG